MPRAGAEAGGQEDDGRKLDPSARRGLMGFGIQSGMVELHHLPDFENRLRARYQEAGRDADRLFAVLCIDDGVTADLFAGLGKRAVDNQRLGVTQADRGRRRGRVKRSPAQEFTAGHQLLDVRRALRHQPLLLGFPQAEPSLFVQPRNDHEFHLYACFQ